MNRQLRRLTEKEERRQKGNRAQAVRDRAAIRKRAGIFEFLREVRAELKRVSWPTRQEVVTFTAVTLITTTVITLFIFALDFAFKQGVLELIRNLTA